MVPTHFLIIERIAICVTFLVTPKTDYKIPCIGSLVLFTKLDF